MSTKRQRSERVAQLSAGNPGADLPHPSAWTYTRRGFLGMFGLSAVSVTALASAVGDEDETAPEHYWSMAIDIANCIGCGRCVAACRAENDVPEEKYRTWVERYVVFKDRTREVHIDSPSGGEFGFPVDEFPADEILRAFYVPKLCNHCVDSACTQVCPVGATFEGEDGVVLVDPEYCVGCAYCVQACPYGCRFINPETQVADKCTLCYHRITEEGQVPACVQACPNGARNFGDLNDLERDPKDVPPERAAFVNILSTKPVGVLKPHLGTRPKIFYANLTLEVS